MTQQQTSQSVTTEPSQLSVGEQFRQAREKNGLTIDEVSKKLNLRPVILQHIENNEFVHKKIPATFMKGYVRNYAKLLKLPEEIWINAVDNFGDSPKNDFERVARTERVTNPHSHSRWVGYLTAIVIVFVVAMTALWWWENYQQSNNERDNLVQNYTPTSSETSSTTASSTVPSINVATDNTATQDVQPVATTEPNSVQASSEQQPLLPTNVTNSASETAPAVAENPAASQQSAVQNETVSQPANNAQANAESTEQTATKTEQAQPAVSGDLQIEITSATSWISVKDSARKVLAQKEYKKGEILSFDKGAPYAVIIGAPGNVKITYKGENYPLKVDGRIAKFKLQ